MGAIALNSVALIGTLGVGFRSGNFRQVFRNTGRGLFDFMLNQLKRLNSSGGRGPGGRGGSGRGSGGRKPRRYL